MPQIHLWETCKFSQGMDKENSQSYIHILETFHNLWPAFILQLIVFMQTYRAIKK